MSRRATPLLLSSEAVDLLDAMADWKDASKSQVVEAVLAALPPPPGQPRLATLHRRLVEAREAARRPPLEAGDLEPACVHRFDHKSPMAGFEMCRCGAAKGVDGVWRS